jgi:DNA-binding NarL/FixJ family response regulator
MPRQGRDLTPRQRDVARLIGFGYTNAQIAARLVLQPGTVANHVAHILFRLGLRNRSQVAVWAARQGLIDGPHRAQQARVA